ncbi:hypothetical protein TanjilG_20971 [Lupinus angustifolius]|uniref:Exostosin GT47 domain-containing protein n=1 Tax=Lupinus angustifolius TaxID=3871 RepID=A0A1J7HRE9_LUPAN|nr:PREDICTED: probable glycosyltransferase At5g25310 [Lupinus angustifolius]OIW03043.1 hypothetical protein TanjilG_20971 [Lupinus angustifolius]
MGQKHWSLFHLEMKTLLWLIGITFAVFLACQYLELPYRNALFSLLSTWKVPTSGSSAFQAIAENFNNVKILSQPNSAVEHALEVANKTKRSCGIDTLPRASFVSKPGSQQNESLRFECDKSSVVESIKELGNISATQQAGGENFTSRAEDGSRSPYANSPSPTAEKAPTYLTPPLSTITKASSNITNSVLSHQHNKTNSMKEDSFRPPQNDGSTPYKNRKRKKKKVTTVPEMNELLLQSHATYRSEGPRWSSAVDQELLQARSEIENAPIVKKDPNLYAPIYQNVSMFKRSYELMEETLKVYIYKEGDKPILHSPFFTGIYSSEGWFMKLMEANTRFVTHDPKKANLFYLPYSSRNLVDALYVEGSHSHDKLIQFLHDYVNMIAAKHPFWNRTRGADHFLVACHDWAPVETQMHMGKCIRALCNADVKDGFVFGKDVSLPETFVRDDLNPTKGLGGSSASKRKYLAFFAGRMHGYVRPILLQHWKNKDPDMKIFGELPNTKGDRNYIHYMKNSRYCICAKGYEVNSPRVVEAIFYQCIPVIISDNFVPPFLEVLNWESFSVIVLEKDIPNLKSILLSIPEKRYLQLRTRVKRVRQHFLWHHNPVKYDLFHMILHSVWYNRVFSATTVK